VVQLRVCCYIRVVESFRNVLGVVRYALAHEHRQTHLQEVRDITAILSMTVTYSEIVPEVAVVHVRHQNERVLINLVRIVGNHAYPCGEGIFGNYVSLYRFVLSVFPWRGWCRLCFVEISRLRICVLALLDRRAQLLLRVRRLVPLLTRRLLRRLLLTIRGPRFFRRRRVVLLASHLLLS
jgi:hypothetical protein